NASASQAQDYNFDLQAQGSDPLTTTHSQPLTLHVLDYSFGAPPPLTLYPTTSGSAGFTVTPAAPFDQLLFFNCSAPSGITCSISPPQAMPIATVNLTVNVSVANSVPGGTYDVVISGDTAGQSVVRSTILKLMVRDYAIGASALRKNIYPGQTAQFN